MNLQSSLDGDVLAEFGYARALIQRILTVYPFTRDRCDDEFKELVMDYCRAYHLPIPPSETIRRVRQKVQNTYKICPPSEEVKAKREARAKAIRGNIHYV